MELFAGFNAEELAMMQELLRLLLEDDEPITQQPTPRTSARQDSQALFEGLTSPKRTGGGMIVNEVGWGTTAQTGMAWTAAAPVMPPTPPFATTVSRTRTRSNFASDEEPLHKRGRVDVAPAMRVPVNVGHIPLSEGPRAGYHPYY